MHKPVLGIIGGVGPLATAYFMEILIKKTPAANDQDHMPMIVFNDPQIPDRTAYILDHSKPNPQPEMVKVARWLENAGADYLAIACNTAHYFYEAIANAVNIPVVNIMEETAARIEQTAGSGTTVGLMGTRGTIESGVFQNYLGRRGLKTLAPEPDEQDRIMSLIYNGVKANQPYDKGELLEIAQKLHNRGSETIVVGCTELSVIYQDLLADPSYEVPDWLVDSLDVLADRCVGLYQWARKAGGAIEM